MPDDMSSKVDQIKDLLENEAVLENLKNVFGMFSGGSSNNTNVNANAPSNSNNTNSSPVSRTSPSTMTTPNSSIDDSMKLVMKVKKIYDKMSNINDPGITLLTSLKPYLSSSRRNKLDTAIKAMHLSKLSGIMHDLDE